VAGLVAEVTDDKTLPKDERKLRQIEHASEISRRAKLLKLADKTSNLRSLADSPPADWSLERKQQYLQWAQDVVARLRGPTSGSRCNSTRRPKRWSTFLNRGRGRKRSFRQRVRRVCSHGRSAIVPAHLSE
jgi:hypothetical protein